MHPKQTPSDSISEGSYIPQTTQGESLVLLLAGPLVAQGANKEGLDRLQNLTSHLPKPTPKTVIDMGQRL